MTQTKTPNKHRVSRRDFLRTAAIAGAAFPAIVPASALGAGDRPAPSERITLGCIGVGNQGTNDMRAFLHDERVQVVAVCDVNRESETGYWSGRGGGREPARRIVDEHYGSERTSGKHKACDAYEDFRDIITRDDIDAVLCALPDQWHAIPVVAAAYSGKDIYAEKPLSLTVRDGRAMADAVHKNERVFQCGSQQRSDERFRFACELVRNQYIGTLKTVTCGLPDGTPDYSRYAHRTDPEPVPFGFNYDFWLGPAPLEPYAPARTHVNWRWVFDYSGGQVTDWGGHHPDIAQWGMNTEHTGPVKIRNARAEYADHPIYDTAVKYYFECEYDNGVELIVSSDARSGVTFEGTDGWVWVDRGRIDAEPESLLDVPFSPKDVRLYKSENHFRNFIDCVYSREEPIAPIETAHRSITIAHLGNIAMWLGRDLTWDPMSETFPNDPEANEKLSRVQRPQYTLDALFGLDALV